MLDYFIGMVCFWYKAIFFDMPDQVYSGSDLLTHVKRSDL